MPTIVDIAVSNDAFSTLVTAVSAASLVEALQSPVHLQYLRLQMMLLQNFLMAQLRP